MKLSDFENEKALDLLADILEPSAEIMKDTDFVENVMNGNRLKAVQIALKSHKKSVIEILAALNDVPVEKYRGNIVSMTKNLLEMFNDKELLEVFSMQGQTIL